MAQAINIYICSNLCSDKTHKVLFSKYGATAGNAGQKFFMLLASGLAADTHTKVCVYSILPINFRDQKKIFWHFKHDYENGIKYDYISLINIPVVRNLITGLNLFLKILFKKVDRSSETIYLVDYLRLSINTSVILACRLRKIKTMAVVTDLPGYDVVNNALVSRIRNKVLKFYEYDNYVSVTRALDDVVNPHKHPSIIIEGIANSRLSASDNLLANKYSGKVVIYAGSLYEEYGIGNLIKAFMLLPDQDAQLWFFGVGPFSNQIVEYTNMDQRVLYKGVVSNDALMGILLKATLLVNPRPTYAEYTKYSFPSKNLEYMSTGTPLMTTRLAGIPEDHHNYVYFFSGETENDLTESLQIVLGKDPAEIHKFGLAAKEYVLKTKNNLHQAQRIIEMIL